MTTTLITACPSGHEIEISFDDRIPHAAHCPVCDAPLDWGALAEQAQDAARDEAGEGGEA